MARLNSKLGSLWRRVRKRLKDESGQALVITALCMTCLLGFVALAADIGVMLREKRLTQSAADSAAIAGAAEIKYGDVTAAANAASAQNGFSNGTGGATVTVSPSSGPLSGPYAGNPNYVEVIVSQSQPTIFMVLFGRTAMTVTARAVATLGASQGCIYALGTAGTGITFNGVGNTNMPNCSILDNSSLMCCGSGSLTVQSIGVVGGYSHTGGTLSPTPPTPGIVPVSDPLSFLTPPANPGSCVPGTVTGTSPVTLQPGCYNGLSIEGGAPVTLAAGIYYINGPFSYTGAGPVTGTDVTIYLPTNNNDSFTLAGSGPVTLSAPTSGTYNGILFYQDPANNAAMLISGAGALSLQGIIYAPAAAVTMNGAGTPQLYTPIISNSLMISGTTALQDYKLQNPGSPLTAPRLVE